MQPASLMQVISVNVGQPRKVLWNDQIVETGIYKEAVEGRVAVRRLNIEGDRQADLTVHGGLDKAIYALSSGTLLFLARAVSRDGIALGNVR